MSFIYLYNCIRLDPATLARARARTRNLSYRARRVTDGARQRSRDDGEEEKVAAGHVFCVRVKKMYIHFFGEEETGPFVIIPFFARDEN